MVHAIASGDARHNTFSSNSRSNLAREAKNTSKNQDKEGSPRPQKRSRGAKVGQTTCRMRRALYPQSSAVVPPESPSAKAHLLRLGGMNSKNGAPWLTGLHSGPFFSQFFFATFLERLCLRRQDKQSTNNHWNSLFRSLSNKASLWRMVKDNALATCHRSLIPFQPGNIPRAGQG